MLGIVPVLNCSVQISEELPTRSFSFSVSQTFTLIPTDFLLTRYIYILHRSEGGRKKTTTENQRFSVVFYGLIDPLVIRLGA